MDEATKIILIGCFYIVVGLLSIWCFVRARQITKWSLRYRGLKAESPERFNRIVTNHRIYCVFVATICLAFGIAILIRGLTYEDRKKRAQEMEQRIEEWDRKWREKREKERLEELPSMWYVPDDKNSEK